MFRILSDEIAAILVYLAIMLAGWFYLGSGNLLIFILLALLFSALFWLTFLGIKFYAPPMLTNSGRYEDCIKFCKRELDGRYSLINFIHSSKHLNYFRMHSAYCRMKMGDFSNAEKMIDLIDEKKVLAGQFILLRMIKSHMLINNGKFGKALELLINIQTGTLSNKFLPDIFYLISLCYLELGRELERALNYAQVAFSLRQGNPDYKLNYAVALYKAQKRPFDAKAIMDDMYSSISELSAFSRARLVYYLKILSKEMGDEEASKKYESMLKNEYVHTSFSQVTIN